MWDAQKKEGIYIITLAQKIQTVRMNLKTIAVITKNYVFLYSTANNHELI